MIKVCFYDGSKLIKGGAELIALPIPEGAVLWIDIEDEPIESEQVIFDQFDCHPLTIQDARRLRHPPKTEHFSDQSFVLVRELSAESAGFTLDTLQISSFIGDKFLITVMTNLQMRSLCGGTVMFLNTKYRVARCCCLPPLLIVLV